MLKIKTIGHHTRHFVMDDEDEFIFSSCHQPNTSISHSETDAVSVKEVSALYHCRCHKIFPGEYAPNLSSTRADGPDHGIDQASDFCV